MQAHYDALGIVQWQRRGTESEVTEVEQEVQTQTAAVVRQQIGLMLIANGDLGDNATGQLLTAMLNAIELKRSDVCIVDVDAARQQLEKVKPAIILVMGEDAAQALLQCQMSLELMRNQAHHYGCDSIPLYVTYHPGHLLTNPADKRGAWTDLQKVKKLF